MNNPAIFRQPLEIVDADSHVRVTSEGLNDFNDAFADPQQRESVQKIDFQILLPDISVKRLKKLQGRREAAANNASLTQAIAAFFTHLAAWAPRGGSSGVELTLHAVSPTDARVSELEESGQLVSEHKRPVWSSRNGHRYLDLDRPGPLPEVVCVSKFSFGENDSRLFHPQAIAGIVGSLVSVTKMEWKIALPGRRELSHRKEIRSALGMVLATSPLPPRLTEFTINITDCDPLNERLEPGDLTEADDRRDSLSLGVRSLCQLPILEKLILSGTWILGPAALGGRDFHCRCLKEISIDLSLTTPDGKWLYDGDSNNVPSDDEYYGSEEEDSASFNSGDSDTSDYYPVVAWAEAEGETPQHVFRTTPDPDTFVPLVSSFSAAVKDMPALRRMEMRLGGEVKATSAPLVILYYAPGEGYSEGMRIDNAFEEENADRPRWYLIALEDFDKAWTVPVELEQVFAGASGQGRHLLYTNPP